MEFGKLLREQVLGSSKVVLIEPTEQESEEDLKMNLNIIRGIMGPVMECLIEPYRYPEVFGERENENPIVHHFNMTVSGLIREIKGAYAKEKCPAVIKLASDHFNSKIGSTAIEEFIRDCAPIVQRWQPGVLKGDPNYRTDYEARNLVRDISSVDFLKVMKLMLLWDGDKDTDFPGLPLAKKHCVIKAIKRMESLGAFYRFSLISGNMTWFVYNLLLMVLEGEEGVKVFNQGVEETGIDPNKVSYSELTEKMVPYVVDYMSGKKCEEMMGKLFEKISLEKFVPKMTGYIKHTNKEKKEPASDEVLERVIRKVTKAVSKVLS